MKKPLTWENLRVSTPAAIPATVHAAWEVLGREALGGCGGVARAVACQAHE